MVEFYSNEDKVKRPALITPWSFIHFLFGILAYSCLKKKVKPVNNILISNVIHGIYEIKDIIKSNGPNPKTYWSDNSLLNSLGDTIVFNLGLSIGYFYDINPLFSVIIYITCSVFFYYFNLD